jgi:PP-loop superfamily ATP-utilizing enzyme
MALSQTQKQLLDKIQSNLRRGDIEAIAKKTSLSRVWISRTLSSNYDDYNEDIVKEAVDMIAKREQVTKDLLKKINC